MNDGLKPLWDFIASYRLVSAETGSESERSSRTSGGVSKELAVSDPVWIRVDGRRVDGHIAEKARTHCHVVAEGGESYKAPWPLVFARGNAERKYVTTRTEEAKAKFRAGDEVEFPYKGTTLKGKISRLNPKRAAVVCDDQGEWRVQYGILVRTSPERDDEPGEVLKAVAARAERLMSQHGLDGWSFQYDDASTRAGACRYDTRVISIARQYCLQASEEELTDTILHEIAHALVGWEHRHDAVWKRKALEIGCRPERCHSVNFARPKYILSCPQCKWAVRRHKRQRGLVCSRCKSKIVYRTFSDELWKEARKSAEAVAGDA